MWRKAGAALNLHREVIFLMGMGGALRFFMLENQSLWYDELFQNWVARQSLPQVLAQVAADGQTPPLYYLVTHFWLALVDWLLPASLASHPEFFLRLPSVICAIGLLVVLYRLALHLFEPGVAKLALAFCALNPLLVGYGQEGRAYSLALLLVASSFLIFWRLMQGQISFQNWLLYIIISIAAIYTHYYAVYPLLAQSLFFGANWLYPLFKERLLAKSVSRATQPLAEMTAYSARKLRLWPKNMLWYWLIAKSLIALSFLPWLQVWFEVVRHTSSHLTVEAFAPLSFTRHSFGWLGLGNVSISPGLRLNTLEDWAATVLLGLGLFCLFYGTKLALAHSKEREWTLIMLWFGCTTLGPALLGQVIKLDTAPRYAIQATPPFMMAFAWALKVQGSKFKVQSSKFTHRAILRAEVQGSPTGQPFGPRFKEFLIIIVHRSPFIVVLLMGWGLAGYYFNPDYARSDWRGVLKTVAVEAEPGDLLLGFPFHHFDPAQLLYLEGREWPERAGGWSFVQSGALYFPGQRWDGYADFNGPQTAPSPDLAGDLARLVQPYRRIWLVAYNDPTNVTILTWLNQHYYSTPPRYFGPHQSLMLYKYEG